jgi:hypothetical protein
METNLSWQLRGQFLGVTSQLQLGQDDVQVSVARRVGRLDGLVGELGVALNEALQDICKIGTVNVNGVLQHVAATEGRHCSQVELAEQGLEPGQRTSRHSKGAGTRWRIRRSSARLSYLRLRSKKSTVVLSAYLSFGIWLRHLGVSVCNDGRGGQEAWSPYLATPTKWRLKLGHWATSQGWSASQIRARRMRARTTASHQSAEYVPMLHQVVLTRDWTVDMTQPLPASSCPEIPTFVQHRVTRLTTVAKMITRR